MERQRIVACAMASPSRSAYVQEFMCSLVPETTVTPPASTVAHSEQERGELVRKVLTEALSESLSGMEDRFRTYLDQLLSWDGDESILMRAKRMIVTSEKPRHKFNMDARVESKDENNNAGYRSSNRP